jgi:hypothetical protein
MRFSEHYNISKPDEDDWFDLVLSQGTMLAADLYLAFDDAHPRWDADGRGGGRQRWCR